MADAEAALRALAADPRVVHFILQSEVQRAMRRAGRFEMPLWLNLRIGELGDELSERDALATLAKPSLKPPRPDPYCHFITSKEAAVRLKVTPGRISQMVKAGDLRSQRVGRFVLIDPADIERLEGDRG